MKKNGWDGNENMDQMQWTFAGSLFYSIIVITTIGEYCCIDIVARNGIVFLKHQYPLSGPSSEANPSQN